MSRHTRESLQIIVLKNGEPLYKTMTYEWQVGHGEEEKAVRRMLDAFHSDLRELYPESEPGI